MLASVCAIGMLAFALIGWISMRRAAHTPHATPSESLSVDVPLALGVALGFLGSLVRGSDAPWIAGGGPVAIPIGAASVGLGWALVRSDRVIDGVRTSDAIGLVTCSILLAASVLTDGLGLAEGAAILLALASWSSVRWTQRPHVQSSHPDGHTGIGAMWGLTLLGILGMHLGLSARVAWGIALVGLLGILPAWRTGTSQRELGSVLGLVVITPLSALATASAARVLMAGAAAGHASHLAGDLWIVGFAQSLASRPVAALPGGFVPEMCLIGVALGVGFCAPKLPIWAHRLLGALVGLLGVGIIGLALAS